MGAKDCKQPIQRCHTRYDNKKPIWEVLITQTPISLSSSNHDESGSRRDQTGRESLREWAESVTRKNKREVVRIDVKTSKTSQLAVSLKLRSRSSARMPQLHLDTAQTMSQPSSELTQSTVRHVRVATDPGFDSNESVFIDFNRLGKRGQLSFKTETSTYKLRRARKTFSTEELQPVVEAKAAETPFSTRSLLNVVKEAKVSMQSHRRIAIKHLETGGGTVFPQSGSTPAPQESPAKVAYSIKTRKDFISAYGTAGRYRSSKQDDKSRAEHLWAWKGKKGALSRDQL